MPAISVIVPVYKVEPYLRRCVDSILAQTFSNFELILVDDGSPDNCPAICDEYAEKDKRIHVIHQENGGLSAARNAGIDWAFANSDSEWISFIDSDDWVANNYLEALFKGVDKTDYLVSSCGYIQTNGELSVKENEIQFKQESPEEYFVESRTNCVIAWGKLYNKECFRSIRFPEGKIHEDEFVTYQILFKLPRIIVIDAQLYYYYVNPTGIMHKKWTKERLAAYEAQLEQLNFFIKNGFQEAYKRNLAAIVNNLANDYNQCNSDYYKRYILNKIRKIIRDNRKYYNIFLSQVPWVCEMAFPIRTKLYWVIASQINKIRKREKYVKYN